ncbi:MAG: phytase [Proteobacteria bacterium]|jgi:3-phytase|nr:phytase [Pseudomonadota bacterium]MDA0994707.1 phytase [Pseudomonadota bacterium]
MKNNILACSFVVLLVACGPKADQSEVQTFAPAVAETAPSEMNSASDPALLVNAKEPDRSLIFGSAGEGGIEVHGLDGARAGTGSNRPSTFIDVRYNFSLGDEKVALIVANDMSTSELVSYVWDDAEKTLVDVSAPIAIGMEAEGLCLYQSPISHKLYAYVLGSGLMQQWELFDRDGRVEGRLTRTVPVGTGAAHCASSDRAQAIFYSQETVGVAVLNAEPESEGEIEYIDFAQPHGRFSGDVKGVTVYEHSTGGYLLVSDADVSRLQVYDLSSYDYIGSLSIASSDGIDGVQESEGLTATSMSLGDALPDGILVLADDDNEADNTNFKVVAWRDIASALELPQAFPFDPTEEKSHSIAIVSPSGQTDPVTTFGDAADDPAIWVHPDDPSLSVIIGTQKKLGINVYDLSGRQLQSLADGRINNADIRYGFMLGGESVDIVTGSNRTNQSISIWKVDPVTRTLVEIADGIIATGMGDPYGQCMYKSPTTGYFYVYINDTDGVVKQWQLVDAGNGKVGVTLVREFSVGSQTEGCTADDELGHLYVGEENNALWKYSAEPDGGDERIMVDDVESGNLTADVEGVSIYYGPEGTGYIIASNQGADNYLVYERQGDNRFLGHFHVVADEVTGIDGASETDGLDVTSANLGPQFPHGVLIVQDGRNITPVDKQNYKIVPWERVAEALGLEVHAGYDPRASH